MPLLASRGDAALRFRGAALHAQDARPCADPGNAAARGELDPGDGLTEGAKKPDRVSAAFVPTVVVTAAPAFLAWLVWGPVPALIFAFVHNVAGVRIAAGNPYPVTGLRISPMIAAAAMSLSSVSVIANALRLRRGGL